MNNFFGIKKIFCFLIIFFTISFNFITLKEAKADYCSDLFSYLENNSKYINLLEKHNDTSFRFGFDVEREISLKNLEENNGDENYPFRRTEEGYLIINKVDMDGAFYNNEFMISPNDFIISINDISTDSLSDKEFDDILALKDEHTFEIYLNNTYGREELINSLTEYIVTTSIKRADTGNVPVLSSAVVPIDLMEIDTKNNEYTLNYHQWIEFYINTDLLAKDFPIPETINEEPYRLCRYASNDENYFDKFKITDPVLIFNDKKEDLATLVSEVKLWIPTKNFFRDNEYFMYLNFFNDKTSQFVTLYDLKLFPFDSQSIGDFYKFHYTEKSFNHSLLSSGPDHAFHAEQLIDGHFTPGFDLKSIEYWSYLNDLYADRDSHTEYGFAIEVKRQNFYHIAKILIPIFLILILSWSSFWIKPKEIEAKLTVTIICFLTLIAYNFVIDSDLPRLDYLTWLDYYILLSYVFCGLTTFASIFEYMSASKRKDLKNNFTATLRATGIPIFFTINIISFYLIKYNSILNVL